MFSLISTSNSILTSTSTPNLTPTSTSISHPAPSPCVLPGEPLDMSDLTWEGVYTYANVLKLYLRELPDPLVTFDTYERFIDAARKWDRWAGWAGHSHCEGVGLSDTW